METLFAGRTVIRLEAAASTNNYALELLRSASVPEGTMVVANTQTAGKGQRGKTWLDEPGKNLLCSFVLRPSFLALSQQYLLNKAIALAVFKTVKAYVNPETVRIKWPNDILINDRKVAGILIENVFSGSQIVSCVAGIGLNVNQGVFPEGINNPVSLKMISGNEFQLADVEADLAKQIEISYLKLKAGKFEDISAGYNMGLWNKDVEHSFLNQGHALQGKIVRVDNEGRLVILCGDGTEAKFNHGEITLLI